MSNEERIPTAGILWDWQIIEGLKETIKPEQISARPDGKDYVEWHEATRIANRVFGSLGWSLTTTMTPTLLSLGNWGEGFYCTRKITVRYRCSEDKEVYTIERDGEGWIKMQAIGKSDAIDMAFKGAASDAISKATKTFGDAFGLSIYAPKGRHAATSREEDSKSGQNGKPNNRPPQNSNASRTVPQNGSAPKLVLKWSDIYQKGAAKGVWTKEDFYSKASAILNGDPVNGNNVKSLSQEQLQKLHDEIEKPDSELVRSVERVRRSTLEGE